jgi:hypothetical protein
MTLPPERSRAIRNAREFLRDLLVPSRTPRIPRDVRMVARSLLKHYPSDYEIEIVAKKCPKVFSIIERDIVEMYEPVHTRKKKTRNSKRVP